MQRYFEINQNGHNIRCKLYYENLHDIKRVVVFLHGFGGHKDNSAAEKFAQRMVSKYKHCAMITFNWPGHGDDVKKHLSLQDCQTYLDLVIDHVRQHHRTEEIYAYGTSFGGYLLLKYIIQRGNPFQRIALRCPAVNMYEVLTSVIASEEDMERLRRGKEIAVGFDRKVMIGSSLLEDIKANDIQQWDYLDYAEQILILHGTEDEVVPFDKSYAFADNNLIEFIPITGADHRFRNPAKMEEAIKQILRFYEF